MSPSIELISTLVLAGTYIIWRLLFGTSRRQRLPPGPRALPILGNIRDFPSPGVLGGPHWAKHKALYGPISSLQAFGKTFIVVNDIATVVQLLDKKSLIYSERPISIFGEMCGYADVISLQGTTEKWRNARKRIHNYIGTRGAVSKLNHSIELEARRLLVRLLASPDTFFEQIQAFAGSLIMKLTFGYCASPQGQDPMVALGNQASNAFIDSVNNLWTVDVFPFLRHLPSWLPGMGFLKVAEEYKRVVAGQRDLPIKFVKSEVANGTALESFIGHELENRSKNMDELQIAWIGGALYGAGADTTVTALETFVLAMALYPDVLRKSQEEVDTVVGQDRLPSLSDMPALPYVEAVMKETLRWNAILHLGLPHAALEDDFYKGYFIPKGSIVFANIWQMCNDPSYYPNPSIFNPDRFLAIGGTKPAYDPRNLVFGFGRRICSGKEFSNASTFIAMAMMIASFNISKKKTVSGDTVEILPDFKMIGGLSHPKPFKCSIVPRSENAKGLIQNVLIEYPYDRDDSKKLKYMYDFNVSAIL